MPRLSPLCQLNGGCMGCCGHDFPSRDKIAEAIQQNTNEFLQINPHTEEEFLSFRNRRPAMDLRQGVCRNLVREKGCTLCPLHPLRHQHKDLRLGHCDVDYFCATAEAFETWDEGRKKAFVEFVTGKKQDNLIYSMKMDRGELMNEFLEIYSMTDYLRNI